MNLAENNLEISVLLAGGARTKQLWVSGTIEAVFDVAFLLNGLTAMSFFFLPYLLTFRPHHTYIRLLQAA